MGKEPLPWNQIEWGKLGKVWAGISLAAGAILGVAGVAAVFDERRQERERNRFRWTDKNRWPHGE